MTLWRNKYAALQYFNVGSDLSNVKEGKQGNSVAPVGHDRRMA
jgi:hypothetical protein